MDEQRTLQWHPAFFAALQIELEEEKDKLIFGDEHQLSKKPMEMDVLVIKVRKEIQIHKNICGLSRYMTKPGSTRGLVGNAGKYRFIKGLADFLRNYQLTNKIRKIIVKDCIAIKVENAVLFCWC